MNLLESMEWRYATKKFDPHKKVSKENLLKMMKVVQLSASSYGLQLYKVLIVENQKIKTLLQKASYGQSQISEASHLFVFCNYTSIENEDVDQYIQLRAKKNNIDEKLLTGYGDFMKTSIDRLDHEETQQWTSNQVYIALANLLSAAAVLKIDSCPIEGFDNKAYNEILGLDNQHLNAAVVASVGYRSEDDLTQFAPKVRKSMDDLFEVIT